MDKPEVIPGQNELDALYSAARRAPLGADQHEKLRVMAQVILGLLQRPVETEAEKDEDEDLETPEPSKKKVKG